MTTALDRYKKKFATKPEVMSLMDYLEECKTNKDMYLNPHERLLKAIGEPTMVQTKDDPALSRLHDNRVIKVYNNISKHYLGQYDVIESIVSFLRNAARGLEASRQILYLLGPVGGGKSTLAELLKRLMEQEPFYALALEQNKELVLSPIYENPLWLFNQFDADELGIPEHYLVGKPSPWANKRLEELNGDISKFKVVKLYPDESRHIAVAKTEPGDENNQDISSLVGKLDISKVGMKQQSDPDCYEFSGSLCRGNRGIMEFVEMFKAPIKLLHPLLTATQEHNYNPTEQFPSIPHEGLILAHSNMSEWEEFRNNKNNVAFIDRTFIIKVPYELRLDNVIKIYSKEINKGALKGAPRDPQLLSVAAKFQLAATLNKPSSDDADMLTKIRIYNGEDVVNDTPGTLSYSEHRNNPKNINEGMDSPITLREMFKLLGLTFDRPDDEISATTVDLFLLLEHHIKHSDLPEATRKTLKGYLNSLEEEFLMHLNHHIESAYLGGYSDQGQKQFERYVSFADAWCNSNEFVDDEGVRFNRSSLDSELSKIEKKASKDLISNPTDYRNEVVQFVLRYQAKNNGKMPSWTENKKIYNVFKESMLSGFVQFVPIIANDRIQNESDEKSLNKFKHNMRELGYSTDRIIKRVIDYWNRKRTS